MSQPVDHVPRILARYKPSLVTQRIERSAITHAKPSIVLPNPRALPGDPRRLRGIPVVGARGVSGAIPGTRPG